MKTLFLDFCSHQKVFAIVDDTKTLALTHLADHTDEASVMPTIEKLVKDAKLTMKDIHRIAAITGPGGFMSQRVGLTVASTLAWSLKIPIGGVHLSDLWLARVEKGVLWIHSTKRELMFIRSPEAKEPTLISLDDLKKSLKKSDTYVGELLPEQKAILSIEEAMNIEALENVLPKICSDATYGKPPLLPWYGRGI
jgi:tRNA threonylcarbamoyl adenosine modification protein YeaZ